MAKKQNSGRMKIGFEEMIGKGENSDGFTAQTCNGTAHWQGTGWNRELPNWHDYDFGTVGAGRGGMVENLGHQITEMGPWKGKRSNRTGE